ncbi:MAG: YabP/YqfC family sporulation protein [Bacilli bacterium]
MKKIKLVRALSDYVNDKKFSIIYKNNKLDIINYSKILDFSDTKISINYLDDIYIIIGTNLVISKMMEEELLITGNIESISFNK